MASIQRETADTLLASLNRTPLFMTSLDETDGAGGENVELEALRALAHEGTRAEVAANFRAQGNEQAKLRRWGDAAQFYDRALAALREERKNWGEEGEGEGDGGMVLEVEVDEEEERRKEREIEEACYANRALCNLEKGNYRSCLHDCAAALRLNPRNTKALYRSAAACLALDRLPEATDACDRALSLSPRPDPALAALSTKIAARGAHLDREAQKRRERSERLAAERAALARALAARGIRSRRTPGKESAAADDDGEGPRLADALDPASALAVPLVLLYPRAGRSDLVRAAGEAESVGQHLQYVFPLPWDERGAYSVGGVECFAETRGGGGLVKVGKKVSLLKVLAGGGAELVDGGLRLYVVPKGEVAVWVEDFKSRAGKGS